MNYQNLGNGSGWITDDDVEPNPRQEAIETLDLLTEKNLQAFQKIVALYVNLGDHAALDAFQTCLGTVLRQASEAMQKGVKMEISDNERNDIN